MYFLKAGLTLSGIETGLIRDIWVRWGGEPITASNRFSQGTAHLKQTYTRGQNANNEQMI